MPWVLGERCAVLLFPDACAPRYPPPRRLLRETFEPELLTPASEFGASGGALVEVGPRMSFSTAWSANAVSICASCGLGAKVDRVEVSRRYRLASTAPLAPAEAAAFAAMVSAAVERG